MSNPQASTTATKVLERYGLTVQQVLESPEEVHDVPSPPYPPGRKYHFAANREVALIVDEHGILVSSLPGHKAWESLESYDNDEATTVGVFRMGVGWVTADCDRSHPWNAQHLITPAGIYTAHRGRKPGVVIVLLGQDVVFEGTDPNDLEDTGIPSAVIELVWYVRGVKQ